MRLFMVLFLVASIGWAQQLHIGDRVDITLTDGTVHPQSKIHDVAADSIIVFNQEGALTIKRSSLPPDFAARIKWPATPAPVTVGSSPAVAPPMDPVGVKLKAIPVSVTPKPRTAPQDKMPIVSVDLSPLVPYGKNVEASILSQKLQGQVFVVTKGGTNYKLGEVRVEIWPIEEYMHYQMQIVKRTAALNSLRSYSDRMSDAGRHSESLEALNKLIDAGHDIDALMPTPRYYAYTDADGRYLIEHKVGEAFYVVAKGHRQIGDETERYRWRIESKEIPSSGQLMLSNRNMR